jgi:site-specific DNA-adenine methylase
MAKPNHIPAGLVAQRSLAPRRGRSASCTVICGEAFEFLASYPFTGRELVYCDPPSLHETRS